MKTTVRQNDTMKKTFLITSILLTFLCFSCDDEPIDFEVEDTTTENPSNPTDPTDPSNPITTLTTYSYDTTSTVPILGEIMINTDFNIANNVVSSANVETIIASGTSNTVATITRDANGRVIQSENTNSGNVTNKTTITYTGDNITEIAFEDLEDSSENYTYTFTYNGNTVTRTNATANKSTVFTFNTNSRLISKESFSGNTSTQREVLTYANGNCINSTVTGTNQGNNTFLYDDYTNPLKTPFNDQYLVTIFDSENNDEIGSVLATFYTANNWVGIQTNQGSVNFDVTYDANNNITARSGNFDLGDGVVINQSEAFQY